MREPAHLRNGASLCPYNTRGYNYEYPYLAMIHIYKAPSTLSATHSRWYSRGARDAIYLFVYLFALWQPNKIIGTLQTELLTNHDRFILHFTPPYHQVIILCFFSIFLIFDVFLKPMRSKCLKGTVIAKFIIDNLQKSEFKNQCW